MIQWGVRLAGVGLLTVALLGATAAGQDEPKTLDLKVESGNGVLRIQTPTKVVSGGVPVSVKGDSGTVSLLGTDRMLAAQIKGSVIALGLDGDGDGKIAGAELQSVKPGGAAAFAVTVERGDQKDKLVVVLNNVRIYAANGKVTMIAASAIPGSALKGGTGSQTLRLIDDNLDGQITQDGKDAVAIGSDNLAVPLLKLHTVGGKLQEVAVEEGGSKVTLTPSSISELGQVKVSMGKAVQGLVLVDSKAGAAFDISAGEDIPAGSYQVCYGILGRGTQYVTILPGSKPLVYPVEAGKRNELRIGPPLRVEFRTSLSEGQVHVEPMMSVVGSGGEVYDLDPAGGLGLPKVTLMAGNRPLSSQSMAYG